MMRVADYIRKRLIKIALSKGIDLRISQVKIQRLHIIRLDNIIAFHKTENLSIESIIVNISIINSIINRAIYGEIIVNNIKTNFHFISDKCFQLPKLTLTFKICRNFQLLNIDIDNLSVTFQASSTKDKKQFYIETNEAKWDDLLIIFRNNFLSEWMVSIKSESHFTLSAVYQLNRQASKLIPSFNAFLNSTDLKISYTNNKQPSFPEIQIHIPYKDIPIHIINAVIFTEDPLFWQHKGISAPFIGLALNDNIIKKSIHRGSSTISMQVIKNLFLSNDRTFVRKIEEVLLTLLMENYYKISKTKILELYFNIIEFAPNTYGLYNACKLYFAKDITELSFTECLVLTYIIPRPKYFYEALLSQTRQLKNNLYHHIELYSSNMLKNGYISNTDYDSRQYYIKFASSFGEINLYPYPKQMPRRSPWMVIAWNEFMIWKCKNLTMSDSVGSMFVEQYIQNTGENLSPKWDNWCGCFVDWVLKKSNQVYNIQLPTVVENPSSSQNYACADRYPGTKLIPASLNKPEYGSIVILKSSGWKGHVGFIVDFKLVAGKIYAYVLGGNQYDKVCVQMFEVYKERNAVKYRTENGNMFVLKGYILLKP